MLNVGYEHHAINAQLIVVRPAFEKRTKNDLGFVALCLPLSHCPKDSKNTKPHNLTSPEHLPSHFPLYIHTILLTKTNTRNNNSTPLQNYNSPTMLFTNVFTYTVALAAALPMVLGQDSSPFHPKYAWDEDLKVFKLGSIPSRSTKNPNRAADWLGRCHEGQVSRGSDIGLGDYGCGEFKNLGTAICKFNLNLIPIPPLCFAFNVQIG